MKAQMVALSGLYQIGSSKRVLSFGREDHVGSYTAILAIS